MPTAKKKTPATALSLEVTLLHTKSTKGTHVFTDDSEDAPIPSLYIRKSAFPGDDPPRAIVLTISEGKE